MFYYWRANRTNAMRMKLVRKSKEGIKDIINDKVFTHVNTLSLLKNRQLGRLEFIENMGI